MEVFLIKALQFFLAISLLVLLHEGGHFLFSKLFGVRVNKFYVFFDWKFSLFHTNMNWFRRLRGKVPVKKNENGEVEYDGTEYGIGWIPLGGYCQIEGMIDETQHDAEKLKAPAQPWEFRAKPTWQRLLIMIGGVLVNFVLALFIYSMVLFAWGNDYVQVQDYKQGMVFNEDAKALGFQDHDILLCNENGDFDSRLGQVYIRQLSNSHQVTVLRNGEKKVIDLPDGINLLKMVNKDQPFVEPFIPNEIDSILSETPAEQIGLQKGDRYVSINGKEVESFNAFSFEMKQLAKKATELNTAADSLALRNVQLVINRAGMNDTLAVTLTEQFTLGFAPKTPDVEKRHDDYSFFASFPAGWKFGMNVLGGYVSDLKYVFTSDGAKSLGGFGTIGNLFPAMWDWHMFWMMTAFLSIILAFMNILPIPALDGGHVLFLLYEMITRRKPSDKFMIYAEYVGFGILLVLMVVANLNDILRWIGVM